MNDEKLELDVSRETLQKFEHFADLLAKWNKKINLVAPSSLPTLWSRHVRDSTQLFQIPPEKGHWVDMGSGGGFPGIVIAILAAEHDQTKVTLIESDQRKSAFLQTVVRELDLPAKVLAQRIEDAPRQGAQTVSARALAPLTKLLHFAERHLAPEGTAIFPKGEKADLELADALENWRFSCEKHPSLTDARSTILCIGEIARA